MIGRIWRTSFDPTQKSRLVEYAVSDSLPVLASRPGNEGVFFFSQGDDWITFTLWRDASSIAKLDDDPQYAKIVEGILALGVLGDEQHTTTWNYEGGTFNSQG